MTRPSVSQVMSLVDKHVPIGSPGNLQHGPGGWHPTNLLATADKDVEYALGIRIKWTRGSNWLLELIGNVVVFDNVDSKAAADDEINDEDGDDVAAVDDDSSGEAE